MQTVADEVRMLAEWFVEAYKAACAKWGRATAAMRASVQEMRRLYVTARARCAA